jgi:branched-chain amino acid transport system permease protein
MTHARVHEWTVRLTSSFVAMGLLSLLVAGAIVAYGDDYVTVIALGAATYIALGLGLNVVLGYAGLLDIGYAAFFAIGAYASAICTLNLGLNFFLSIPVAIAATALAGVIIGYPTLRLRPDYLAIATIGFGEVVRTIVNNWEYVGASRGLYPLPVVELFGLRFETIEAQLGLVAVLVSVAIVLVNRLGVSHLGRAWRAIRDDDFASEAIGIPTLRLKIGAYIGGGVIGALAGAVFASRSIAIDPTNFTLLVSVQVLIVVVLGGLGSVRGVVLAAVLFVALPEILRSIQDYRMLVFSVLIILMVRFRPQGLIAERPISAETVRVLQEGVEPEAPPERERPEPGTDLLAVSDVSQRFGGLRALDGVSFTVRAGEVFGLIGPNGAGKTTTVNAITGVNRPTAGRIALGGRDIVGLAPHRIAELGVTRTFQGIRLFDGMSVVDNVIAGEYGRSRLGVLDAVGRPRREAAYRRDAIARARVALERAHVDWAAARRPGELSYPDRRRVEIARALAPDPTLLILDEPAAGMTPTEKAELVELLREIVSSGTSVVVIEHDMPLVTAIADRVAVLDQGRLIALGDAQSVMQDPVVVDAYLGTESGAPIELQEA